MDLPAAVRLLVRRGRRPGAADRRARSRCSQADPETQLGATSIARARRELVDAYRLAYLDEAPVNWCPALGTVLANEEVTTRGAASAGTIPVYRRPLQQWMLRITAYADRLLQDLDLLDWTESIKRMQRNWIGRSEGAEVDFPVEGHEDAVITVFTTRPDTLFGATYMVLAPEHPWSTRSRPTEWPGASLGEDMNDIPLWWCGIFGAEAGRPDAVRRYREFAAQQERARATGRRQGEDRRLHRRVRDEPVNEAADPDLHRRLRADGIRHGGDHGGARARPARLRVRAGVRACRSSRDPAAATGSTSMAIAPTPADWPEAYAATASHHSTNDEVPSTACPSPTRSGDHRVARRAARSASHRHLQAARLVVQPAALLGRTVPDRLRRGRLPVAVHESKLPVELPEMMDFEPEIVADDVESVPAPPLARADAWVTVELDLPAPSGRATDRRHRRPTGAS